MSATRTLKRRKARVALAALLCAAACVSLRPSPAKPGRKEDKDEQARLAQEELARYAPIDVTWSAARGPKDVRRVFPHPVLPGRVLLVAGDDLLASQDSGATWQVLGARKAGAGTVRDVTFSPDAPDTFYLASADKGVWASDDAGKTFRQIGSKRAGLISDSVWRVYVFPGDLRFRTLLALHGTDAAGISRSYDAGKTWEPIATDYHVRRIFHVKAGWADRETFIVIARRKSAPDIESGFSCSALDDLWSEALRDIVYADGATSALDQDLYLATADQGLLRVNEAGGIAIGPQDVTDFASVGVTWGPRADKEAVYAYEPRKLGMLLSLDGMKTFTAHSRGLPVSPFVKQGAHVRANANGKRFHAVVNGALYVGAVRSAGLSVTDAAVTPAVFTYRLDAFESALSNLRAEIRLLPHSVSAAESARRVVAASEAARKTLSDTEFRITARVAMPGDGKCKSVVVDLRKLKGLADTPMYDDGRHGDGDAGDGVYGVTFHVDPRRVRQNDWGRNTLVPGTHGLSIKATGQDGRLGGAVAVLGIYDRPEGFVLWDDKPPNPLKIEAGEADTVRTPLVAEAFSGETCIKLYTGAKPWRAALTNVQHPWSLVGYDTMAFWVRAEGLGGGDLCVQLRDAPEYDNPVTTPAVGIAREKLLDGGEITESYRRVAIPLARLLRGSPHFRRERLAAVVFSGQGAAGGTIWIDRITFHLPPEGQGLARDDTGRPAKPPEAQPVRQRLEP